MHEGSFLIYSGINKARETGRYSCTQLQGYMKFVSLFTFQYTVSLKPAIQSDFMVDIPRRTHF